MVYTLSSRGDEEILLTIMKRLMFPERGMPCFKSFEKNQSSQNPLATSNSKLIGVWYHFLKDLVFGRIFQNDMLCRSLNMPTFNENHRVVSPLRFTVISE